MSRQGVRKRTHSIHLAFDADDEEQLLKDLEVSINTAARAEAARRPSRKSISISRRAATAAIRRELYSPEKPPPAGGGSRGRGRGAGGSGKRSMPPLEWSIMDRRPSTAPVGAAPKPPPNAGIAKGKGLRRISFVSLKKPEQCKRIYPCEEIPVNGRFTPTGGFYASDSLEFEFHVKRSTEDPAQLKEEPSSYGGNLGAPMRGAPVVPGQSGRRPGGSPPPPRGASTAAKRKYREAEGRHELETLYQTTMKVSSYSPTVLARKREEEFESDDSDNDFLKHENRFDNVSVSEQQRRRAMGFNDGNVLQSGASVSDPDCRVTLWVPIPGTENPMSYRHLLRTYQNGKLPELTKLVVVMNKLWYNSDVRDVTMVFPLAKVKEKRAFETTMYSVCRTSVILETAVRKGNWILCPARPDLQRYFYDYCKRRLSTEDPSKAPRAAIFTEHRSTFEDPLEIQEEKALNDLIQLGSRPQSAGSGGRPGSGEGGGGHRSSNSSNANNAASTFSPFDSAADSLPPPINARHAALREQSDSDVSSDDSIDPRTGIPRVKIVNKTNNARRNSRGFFGLVSTLVTKAREAKESAVDWSEESQLTTLYAELGH